MIEFVVDSSTYSGSTAKVTGAVNTGTIRIGDSFGLLRDRNNPENTTLAEAAFSVDAIFAYGHEIQELPEGMTGEIELSGGGFDLLSIYERTVLVGTNRAVRKPSSE